MEEVIYFTELYDLYGELLTNKQKEYFENYYFNNLSLSEMAENYDVSRNAIHKQVKNVTDKLNYYESILKLREKSKILNEIIENIQDEKLKSNLTDLLY